MITHIHSTTVYVADQDAAIDFYVNTLGWEKTMDTPMEGVRYVTVTPAGATTQLVLGPDAWVGGADNVPTRTTGISLICDDMDATYATLVARGVRFKTPPEQMPWGDKATWFYDPDGNEFFLNGQ